MRRPSNQLWREAPLPTWGQKCSLGFIICQQQGTREIHSVKREVVHVRTIWLTHETDFSASRFPLIVTSLAEPFVNATRARARWSAARTAGDDVVRFRLTGDSWTDKTQTLMVTQHFIEIIMNCIPHIRPINAKISVQLCPGFANLVPRLFRGPGDERTWGRGWFRSGCSTERRYKRGFRVISPSSWNLSVRLLLQSPTRLIPD